MAVEVSHVTLINKNTQIVLKLVLLIFRVGYVSKHSFLIGILILQIIDHIAAFKVLPDAIFVLWIDTQIPEGNEH